MIKVDDKFYNTSAYEIISVLRQEIFNDSGVLLFKDIEEDDADSRYVKVTCPFHKEGQERKASAGVRKEDGFFHCFACKESMGLPKLLNTVAGNHDMFFGYEWLSEHFETEERNVRELDLGLDRKESNEIITYVSEDELDKYRWTHPYWKKRKISDKWVEYFDLGYEKETNCVTIPTKDIDGNVVFVTKRGVKSKFFNYPKHSEKPVWNLDRTQHLREIIICESCIDAITCYEYDKPFAVALLGLGTAEQFEILDSCKNIRKFILAFDNDEYGIKARKAFYKYFKKTNRFMSYLQLPKNKKDINDLSKEEFDMLEEIPLNY